MTIRLGFYAWNGAFRQNAATMARQTAFMGGKQAPIMSDFIDFSSRSGFDGDAGWTAGNWNGYAGGLILGVPTLCKGETFAQIISGSLDSHYVQMCAQFVANKCVPEAIRLGWEDNVQTTPGYASQDAGAGFTNYLAARRHLCKLIKAQPGWSKVMILMDFAFGDQQVQLSQVWDPATYNADGSYKSGSCDGLGLTVYPQTWNPTNGAGQPLTAEPAFSDWLLGGPGVPQGHNMAWELNGFGTWPLMGDGKTVAPKYITEAGLCGYNPGCPVQTPGKGDDVTWTGRLLNMLAGWGDALKGVIAWDANPSNFLGQFTDGTYPNSGATIKAFFGVAAATSTPTPAPAPTPTPTPAKPAALTVAGEPQTVMTAPTVTLTPNADGSVGGHVSGQAAPAGTHWVFDNSTPRKMGWGDGKGGLSGGLWNNGRPMSQWTWDQTDGKPFAADLYFAPLD